jgi:signal peptidase I
VFVNGHALPRKRIEGRPQVPGLLICDAAVTCEAAEFLETLPSGFAYRVLELERDGPSDNTGIFVVPASSYFVLGDNRDNSEDSRNGLGFVSRSEIFGRAAFKYISDRHWTWQPIR